MLTRSTSMFHCLLLPLMLAALSQVNPRPVFADFVIIVHDADIKAGSQGTLDLSIRSKGLDTLGIFSYYLRITPIAESGGSLRFASTASQTDQAKNDPRYVFGSDSQGLSATRQDTTSIFEIVGSDFASTDVAVDGNERLLARVVLEHNAFDPLTATGSYKISLVQNTNFTFFQDLNGNDVGIATESFANSAVVNIVVAAVPEPTSIALAGLVFPTLLALHRRRRQNNDEQCG